MITLYDRYGDVVKEITDLEEIREANSALNDGKCVARECGGLIDTRDLAEGVHRVCLICGIRCLTAPYEPPIDVQSHVVSWSIWTAGNSA